MENDANKIPDVMVLWKVEDVMEFTGWKRTYISNLCTSGRLPHIPTKPIKFIASEVKKALIQMQVGGIYGRRKAKKRKVAA